MSRLRGGAPPRLIGLVVASVVLTLAIFVVIGRDRGAAPAPPSADMTAVADPAVPTPAADAPLREIELYFPDPEGQLRAEARRLPMDGDPRTRAATLIGALLEGPRDTALARPLPETVQLGGVFLLDDGRVLIDFRAAEPAPPPAGTRAELASVYSVVNSVLLNLLDGAEIDLAERAAPDRVVLLWNGVQPPTFTGQLDTSRPLRAAPERIVR
ncbi:MAG: GerMN domain-containing protein [Acidobacteriota bacterium]